MKEKLLILITVFLISGFISSNPLFAEDIKINKKISGKNYKILELKNNFLKAETKKIHVTVFKTESSGMSTGVAALVGAGIGLVAGAGIGALIGLAFPDTGGSSEIFPPEFTGAVIGGGLGLIAGTVTGLIRAK